jgi:hypothetical protein
MQFEPGNQRGRGGRRPGAGRKKKSEVLAKQTAAAVVQKVIEANAGKLAQLYVERALGEDGDRVLCHAIDKLLPEIEPAPPPERPLAVQIVIESAEARDDGNSHVITIGN